MYVIQTLRQTGENKLYSREIRTHNATCSGCSTTKLYTKAVQLAEFKSPHSKVSVSTLGIQCYFLGVEGGEVVCR